MRFLGTILCAATFAAASPALAEFQQVTNRTDFMQLVGGKTLIRPLVKINVMSDGNISGMGAAWPVSGKWQWQGQYLCRSLEWGGDDLGYNCQEIKTDGVKIRITSDRGTGQSADFRLQ